VRGNPNSPERGIPSGFAIGGFQSFSLCDWPGRVAAVIFCQGCALRCGYCHNPHLIPRGGGTVDSAEASRRLLERRGLIDGVVFSGGEPCLQQDLALAMDAVADMGFDIGLHTAGTHPTALKQVLSRLAWLGLDVKAPPSRMRSVTGANCHRRVAESVSLAVSSGVDLEVRTTWHPALFSSDELFDLAQQLESEGVTKFVLQRVRAAKRSAHGQEHWTAGPSPPPALIDELNRLFCAFEVR